MYITFVYHCFDRVVINGYRKYLRAGGKQFAVDEDKIKQEARYNGKWVLTTNMDLPAPEVALKYKQLWMVEDVFRSMKSLLDTRPIYHKCDETIRGHVFCSFLALLLRKELDHRLARRQWKLEWADVVRDLEQPGGNGSCDQRQRVRFSRPDAGRDGQGLSSLRCSPAAGAALVLNPASVRRRWRENVSLRRFNNRNLLKQWNFRLHGVDDELEGTACWNAMAAATPTVSPPNACMSRCSFCSFTSDSAARWPTAASTTNPTRKADQTANWKPPITRPTRPLRTSLTCYKPPDVLSIVELFLSTNSDPRI